MVAKSKVKSVIYGWQTLNGKTVTKVAKKIINAKPVAEVAKLKNRAISKPTALYRDEVRSKRSAQSKANCP